MEFWHELIDHDKCKMDNCRVHWQYSWETMNLVSHDGFPRNKTITGANNSQFVTIFAYFLPPNFYKCCSNDLKFSGKVVPVHLHELCKNNHH